jgi:hypothetical protein
MEFTMTHSPPEGQRWICEVDGRLYSAPKTQNIGSNASSSILSIMVMFAFCLNLEKTKEN